MKNYDDILKILMRYQAQQSRRCLSRELVLPFYEIYPQCCMFELTWGPVNKDKKIVKSI